MDSIVLEFIRLTIWERRAHLWGMSTPARRRLMRDFKRYSDSQDFYVIISYVIYRHCNWNLYYVAYNLFVHSESLKNFFNTHQVTGRSNVIVAHLTKLLLGVYNHLLRFIYIPNQIYRRLMDNLEYYIYLYLKNV